MTESTGVETPAIAENNVVDTTTDADAKPVVDPAADPAPAVAEADATPKPDKVQERFDKLTREKYDALRERDQERYQREQLYARLEALEKANTKPVAPTNYPTAESVGYDDDKLAKAREEYDDKRLEEKLNAKLEAERHKQSTAQRQQAFLDRQKEFIKSQPDYVEKVLRNLDLPISASMTDIIMGRERGPAIALYLADHSDDARQIAALEVTDQAYEIGRIEAKLETVKAVPAKPAVSQAPPPAPKIEAAESKVEKHPTEMNQTEFNKWRRRFMK